MAKVELDLEVSADTGNLKAKLRIVVGEQDHANKFAYPLAPIPQELGQAFENWRGDFDIAAKQFALRGKRSGLKGLSKRTVNCGESTKFLKDEFTDWLKSQDSWQRLQDCLREHVSNNEEIQLNIETSDQQLLLLPWGEMFLETSPYAETSISLTQQFERLSDLQPKAQVRILAVLGRQDTEYESGSNEQGQKIDISFDSQQLKNTRGRGGYIKVLEQPSAEVLKTALREVKGWHILFFAGHSNSLPDRSIGSIELNANQKPLSIDELKADLSVAINNGLQLAIFNSCDGLGLAAQLAKLNLPQSIVMRERVPDEVAKAFLQQFLDAFSYNHSLFESVRRAREHLRKEFDRKEQLPGASWLPTIVRNPAVPLPYWNDFIADSPLSWPWLMLMVLAVLTVSGSLFLSLFFEFQGFQVESVPKYIHYAQLYPHIVLYPCLFLWGGYFTLYKAWCQIRSRPKLWRQMSIAFAIALVFLGIELSSNRMMLFEIRTGAESVVSPPVSELSSISQIPVEILDVSELIDSNAGTLTVRKADLEIALERYRIFSSNGNTLSDAEKNGYHTFMFRGLSYKTWHGTGGFSTSRIFYALAFMSIIIIVLMSGVFWAEINSKYVYNSMKFLRYIVATQLIILLWLPLRIYQNRVIKDMIFGENIPVSGLDVLAYPAILTLLCISIYRSWRFESSFFAGVLSLLTVLGFIIIGVFNSNMVDITFGLQSDPATWVMWPVMFLIIIYVLYRDIFAKYSTR